MSQPGPVHVDPLSTLQEPDEPPGSKRTAALQPGETLGRYVVLYRLGTGGMGVVYAAYDPQLDRKVALKVLRQASNSPKRRKRAAERLMGEARSMAKITHPNVITVHDATVVGSRVFLAMEHVDGVTLTRHLASGEYEWREILGLLIAAGRGLAAAHDGGLVHRDFKPDNVMLARDGRVLVMDFGLARALEPDDESMFPHPRKAVADEPGPESPEDEAVAASGNRARARASRVAGTPGYMAPEQHRGDATDSRTDQFSFCVTLYEALYRQRPFKGDTAEQIAKQIEAEAIEEPPTTYNVPTWVRSAILRGMRSQPSARWDSMEPLLRALQADPAVHRRKWITRATLGAVVVGAATTATLVGVSEPAACQDGHERLDGVWDADRHDAVSAAFSAVDRPYAADALQGTIAGMDAYAESWLAMRRETCEANRVRGEQSDDLFDLRMECLNRRHAEFRALSGLLKEADVSVVKEAVVATSKLTPLAACADAHLLRTTVPVPEDPDVRDAVRRIRDDLARAKAYEDSARYERALTLVADVLDQAKAMGYPPVLAEAQLRQGTTLLGMGDPRRALVALRSAVHTAARGRHDDVVARAWISLAMALSGSGQVERSAQAVEAADAAVVRAGQHPELVALLANVRGVVAFSLGDYAKAQSAFEEALAMQRKAFGEGHSSLARFYNNLALAHGQQGKLDESMGFLRRALTLEERVLGSVHPRVALITGNLGAMELQRGNLEEGERQLRRSIEISENSAGDVPRLGLMMNNLGEIRLQSLDPEAAKVEFRRAIAHQRRVLGSHPDLGLTLANLGMAHNFSGEPDKALEVLDRSAKVLRETSGVNHPSYAHVLAARGEAELQLGRFEAAIEHLGQAIDRLAKVPGMVVSTDVGHMRFGLARALVSAGRERGRARDLAKQAEVELSKLPSVPLRRQWLDQIATWQTENFSPG